jgi:predicted dehydrogenase
MLGIGVVGYGYWGPNLVRNFSETPGAAVRRVVDIRSDRLESVRARHPDLAASTDIEALLADPEVHAVAIATPPSSHFELAMRALQSGKHVLIEKPLATSVDEATRLIDEARRRGRTLMVDHTFVYSPAVRCIRDLIMRGELGDVLYYDATRINLGMFQHDVDVIWDLAAHDLSILAYLLREPPIAVSAAAKNHMPKAPSNLAYLTLFFAGNMIAHVNVNWLAPVKLRRTIIGGTRRMLVYDDLEPSEKIRVYDTGVKLVTDDEAVHKMLVSYRIGDMWAPAVETKEALRAVTEHFVECINSGRTPETGGDAGLAVVRAMTAATRSVQSGGRAIDLLTLEPRDPGP